MRMPPALALLYAARGVSEIGNGIPAGKRFSRKFA